MAKSINAILVVLAAVLLVPAASYAAGLGTITVRSALGQPLDAEIEVVSLQPVEDIQVRLASGEAYQNAGIDLSPVLQGARFAIERRDGRTIIRMRTSQPVNDPFFSVLVELQSPTGRLSRQYTVLVDPADYRMAATPSPQQAAAAPTPAAVSPTPAVAPARAQAQPPRVAATKVPSPAPTAPVPVAVAPSAPVAPVSAAPQTPSPVVATAPAAAPAPASGPAMATAQSIAGPSAPAVTAKPVEVSREPSPAPPVATQPIALAQPTIVPPPTAPAPAAPETSRPAIVSAQPGPAAIQTPAVTAAPVLADASPATPSKAPEPVAAKPTVESAPAPSSTATPPAPATVQPAVQAAPAPVQPTAAPASRNATAQAAIPATPVPQAPSQPAVAPAPVAQVTAPPVAAPVTAPAQLNTEASDAYRIRRGDTLGAIARKWKPEGISYEQMLVGLYQTNRPVFIRDNINLIRAGATLFIPSRDDVLAINAADAARQVKMHMAAFAKHRDTAVSAGAGSGRISQAQREVISRRGGVKRSSTRAM